MAKQPQSDSFLDMFNQLGRDLKMPSVDVDAILAHHRKNLEALERSARASASGASELMNRQREMLQAALKDVTDMAQGYRSSAANPQEMMTKQADFARRSFEAAVKNASEMAEIVRRSNEDTIEILRGRIRDAMKEIGQGYGKNRP